MIRGVLEEKSFLFSVRIVNLIKYLRTERNEYIMSKQLLRSGTAVRALVGEAEFAQSTDDFISKNSIALKEANESVYWLHLLHDNEYIDALFTFINNIEDNSTVINTSCLPTGVYFIRTANHAVSKFLKAKSQ